MENITLRRIFRLYRVLLSGLCNAFLLEVFGSKCYISNQLCLFRSMNSLKLLLTGSTEGDICETLGCNIQSALLPRIPNQQRGVRVTPKISCE
jgi:hypothetical protein